MLEKGFMREDARPSTISSSSQVSKSLPRKVICFASAPHFLI
jgi:hypothetical protein